MQSRIGRCPTCGETTDVGHANPARPFCSRRCKLIDLGGWLEESRSIPVTDADLPEDNSNTRN
ncbi:MAG: DNA gyrase inhibitor YacG [Pseudomonadota bacterium]|nr:DNA gyrase inhibitor YacG [Pseudomonadota bacterium]